MKPGQSYQYMKCMESKKGIQCTYNKCFRKGQQGSCPAGGQAEGPAPGQLPAQVGVQQVGATRLHLQFSSYLVAAVGQLSARVGGQQVGATRLHQAKVKRNKLSAAKS